MFPLPRSLRFLTAGRQFSDLPLRRRVFLSQLPLAIATVLVVMIDILFAGGGALADPWFLGGVAVVAALTAITAAVPWQLLPTGSYWIIPLLDLAGIFLLAAGAYPVLVGLPMLTTIPVFWMAWSALHPRTTAVVGFASTLLIAWGQYWHAGQGLGTATLGRPLVMPVIVLALAVTANIAVESMVSTDRQLAAALDESRTKAELLDGVLNAANVGVVAVDRHGHDVLMNDKQRRHHLAATPAAHDDATETQLLVFGPGHRSEPLPERARPVYRAVRGEEFTDELIWIGPPDAAEALAVSARRIAGADGAFDGSVIVFKDVTELIRANQAKDRFLASISHELRTPLTSILGYLELAQDEPGMPAPAARSLGVAERNAHTLLQLVNDLLTAAAQGMDLRPRGVDLMDIVHDAVTSHRQAAGAAGLELRLRAHAPVPLAADPGRIGQILGNLLSNAVKYTPAGGTITVTVGHDGGTASVAVTDTGPGMAPDEVAQLFTRFYRADSARRSSIPGTGLGLSIARELAEAHHGTLTVDSVPGRGSTFTVRLPAASVEDDG